MLACWSPVYCHMQQRAQLRSPIQPIAMVEIALFMSIASPWGQNRWRNNRRTFDLVILYWAQRNSQIWPKSAQYCMIHLPCVIEALHCSIQYVESLGVEGQTGMAPCHTVIDSHMTSAQDTVAANQRLQHTVFSANQQLHRHLRQCATTSSSHLH